MKAGVWSISRIVVVDPRRSTSRYRKRHSSGEEALVAGSGNSGDANELSLC